MPIENPKTSSHDSGHPPTARPLAPSPSSSLHSFIYWLFHLFTLCPVFSYLFPTCESHIDSLKQVGKLSFRNAEKWVYSFGPWIKFRIRARVFFWVRLRLCEILQAASRNAQGLSGCGLPCQVKMRPCWGWVWRARKGLCVWEFTSQQLECKMVECTVQLPALPTLEGHITRI